MSTQDKTDQGSEEIVLPSDEERFLIDVEFIQNLSNPKYLSYLAQNKYFQDSSFMEYLKYLRYFKEPEYTCHLIFPTCLTFLDELIENTRFRHELLSPAFIEHIHAQQGSSLHKSYVWLILWFTSLFTWLYSLFYTLWFLLRHIWWFTIWFTTYSNNCPSLSKEQYQCTISSLHAALHCTALYCIVLYCAVLSQYLYSLSLLSFEFEIDLLSFNFFVL